MAIKIRCKSCDHVNEVAERLGGKLLKCLTCGEDLAVPEGSSIHAADVRVDRSVRGSTPPAAPGPIAWPTPHFSDPDKLRFHGLNPRHRADSEQIWTLHFGQDGPHGRPKHTYVGRLLLHPLFWSLAATASAGSDGRSSPNPTPIGRYLGLESNHGLDDRIPADLEDAFSLVRWIVEQREFHLDQSACVRDAVHLPGYAQCMRGVFRREKTGDLMHLFVAERSPDPQGNGGVEVELHGVPSAFDCTASPEQREKGKGGPPQLVPPKHAAQLNGERRALAGETRYRKRRGSTGSVVKSGWSVTHSFGGHRPRRMGNSVDGLLGYPDAYPEGDPRQ